MNALVLVFGAIQFAIIILVFQTADVVIKAALFEYATTGRIPELADGLDRNLGWSHY